jgi:hypothetical protein
MERGKVCGGGCGQRNTTKIGKLARKRARSIARSVVLGGPKCGQGVAAQIR